MKCLTTFFLSLLLWQSTGTADAGFIASFTANGSAFTPSAINVGDTIDVDLYLLYDGKDTETDPDPADPNFLRSPGLLTAGVGISFTPGILNAAFLSYGTGWDKDLSGYTIDNFLGFASLKTTVFFFDPAVTDGGTNAILLGTFRFTGVAAGTSLFTLTDADPGTDDTAVDDADVPSGIRSTILDSVIDYSGTASITVNGAPAAVPEPSTGILFLLGAGVLAWRRRRLRTSPV
jgi:hypothetical protein